MASAKRKQDEKHLKTLRELVSQGGNKECFDCRQRGPTYVNMTIGSFVCTSCSGMLRGLTPPHRVKSISMATFSPEEIDFIKEHGNEHCRGIWLGLMNSNSPLTIDTKDEQKMKDLMSAKYEHKRYYLDPSMANGNSNQKTPLINNAQSNKTSVPHIDTIPILCSPNQKKKSTSNISTVVPAFTPDFVADFSQVPDPFVPTSSPLKFPVQSQPSFADFENNPAFNSSNSMSFNQTKPSMTNFNEVPPPPSEDKYAALKDLDCLMKKANLSKHPSALTHTNDQNTQNGQVSNPFTENGVWNSSLHAINNNNLQPMDNTLCNTANPFRSSQFPIKNESQWIPFESPSCTDVHPSSQLVTPLSGKVWHPTVSAYQANPFMVGTGNPMRSSNNPFL